LKDKLHRYEALLQTLGVDPNETSSTSQAELHRTIRDPDSSMMEDALQVPTPASTTTETERSISTSQLVHGQGGSNFVDK
jgi:hypothetical protein